MTNDTTPAPIGADAWDDEKIDLLAWCLLWRGRYPALKDGVPWGGELRLFARELVRAALASAAQPADAVAYGLEAWVDGAWHLQWPLRPTEADAEQDRAMYSADAKLRLVRLSAAAPKAAPAPAGWLDCDYVKPRALDYPLSDYHRAPGDGPLNATWKDKPHRIVYDLIAAVRYYAQHAPTAQPAPAPAAVAVPDDSELECLAHAANQEALSSGVSLNLFLRLAKIVRSRSTSAPTTQASPAAQGDALTQAARDVLAERQRQISVKGWAPSHDDEHERGEIAYAATSYAIEAAHLADGMQASPTRSPPFAWPWDAAWWKPSDTPRRNLVKSGALILAELERLDRAAARAAKEGDKP